MHDGMLEDASRCSLRRQLPTALQLHILSFLGPNDVALSGRLVSPDLAQALNSPQHCTASLSQPLPPHAAPWAVEAGQQHVRQLPFRHKLQLLCTAAASGSEVNLEVALALLQPSVFPQVLQEHRDAWVAFHAQWCSCDPGEAAVSAGHPQLLGWLLHRCPALLRASNVLAAAAEHCSLAGLQAAWGLLHARLEADSSDCKRAFQQMLDAAAESVTPDAVDKMTWLLDIGRGRCHLQESTAQAAARSGDLGRLRWLLDRGCPMGGTWVLVHALQQADLAVAQWLVDEGVFDFSSAHITAEFHWEFLRRAVASAPGAAAKLQWLQEQGVPPASTAEMQGVLLKDAIAEGQVEALLHLLSVCGTSLGQLVAAAWRMGYECDDIAIRSGSLPMLEYLRQEGVEFSNWAYPCGRAGDVAVVRWLVREAHVPVDGRALQYVVHYWPNDTAAHSGGLLQAVQLLVGEAGCRDWDAEVVLCTAARRGDLALVQYLLQQAPEYVPGGELLVAASEGGCEALLEWLVEQHPGCMEGAGGGDLYIDACRVGDLGTLTALRRLGVPWGAPDILLQALEHYYKTPVLHWLVEQGAPVGSCDGNDRRWATELLWKRRLDPTIAAVLLAWVGRS